MHYDEGTQNYVAYFQNTQGGLDKVYLSEADLAEKINHLFLDLKKPVRLLSCSNMESAKRLSGVLGGREVHATEDIVKVYEDGGITTIARSGNSTQKWRKLKNGEDIGEAPVPGSKSKQGEAVVMGGNLERIKGLFDADIAAKLTNKKIFQKIEELGFSDKLIQDFNQTFKDLKVKNDKNLLPNFINEFNKNPELVEAWRVISLEEFFRISFDDLEIVYIYLQKNNGNLSKLTKEFENTPNLLARRRLLVDWEEAICPPLKYTKGKVYEIDPKVVWKWETKGGQKSIEQIRKLKQDILENGFDITFPVHVIEYRGQILLVDGHHRLAAAKSLGLKKIYAEFITDNVFFDAAKEMKRFRTKQAFYRIVKSMKDSPDNLPDDLMPK